ncbi:MAG: inositol 2-dehydrogenase [Melioribacteraceae bacterium]|nr:inositol 2-dehydrogenase [Melioribacteraceae bacterium]MCF8264188.1 inositol 2-dehydrogenase [Melioribacteraceae bacterium]
MKKLNIGVIGAGRIGQVHIENIVQRIQIAEVVAIADTNFELATTISEKYSIDHAYENYKELINLKNLDAILICSSTDTHSEIIIEAARAGKHVFCEKPIDMTIQKTKEALSAVDASGIKFMVGFNRRFDPNFSKVKGEIQNDKVGDIHIVKITSRDPGPPPIEYILGSGGVYMDMVIHDFDMARFITNSEVDEIFCKGMVRVDPEIKTAGDFDTSVAVLKFVDGTLVIIDNSRKAIYGYDQRLEVFGSKGMLGAENNKADNHFYYDENGKHESLPLHFFMQRYTQSYLNEINEFCESVFNNKIPPVSGRDGLEAIRIAMAAKLSATENRPVKMSEIE